MSSEPTSRRPTPLPFDNPRDEVNAITCWWSIHFSYPLFCRQDWWCEHPQSRSSYANAHCKDVLCIFTVQCASESTSELHRRVRRESNNDPKLRLASTFQLA